MKSTHRRSRLNVVDKNGTKSILLWSSFGDYYIYLISAIENVIGIEVWSEVTDQSEYINVLYMCKAYPNTKYSERELFRV